MVPEESEDLILQDVVPQRHEGRRSCVDDMHAVLLADLLDEVIELLFVDGSSFQYFEVFGFEPQILGEGGDYRVGIKTANRLRLRPKVLREDCRDEALADASLAVKDNVNRWLRFSFHFAVSHSVRLLLIENGSYSN